MNKKYIKPVIESITVSCAQMIAESGLQNDSLGIHQNLNEAPTTTTTTTTNLSRDVNDNLWGHENE